MLTQLDLYLENADTSALYSDLGIKLHGFIMSRINSDYAGELHKSERNPFSLFVYDSGNGFICRISTLTDKATQIIDAMENVNKIIVYGVETPVKVNKSVRSNSIQTQDIPSILDKKRYSMNIVTPATYKKLGKFCNFPNLCKYFHMVMEKLNFFENMQIQSSDVEQLFDELPISEYSLQSCGYLLNGHKIPAMLGGINIRIPAYNEKSELLRLLLGYATYSGIGGKTSLGMGGTVLINNE